MNKVLKTALLIGLTGILALGLLPPQLPAQNDDPVTMVRQYGPDKDMLSLETIEACQVMLDWKNKLHQAQLQQIERLKVQWLDEGKAISHRLSEIQDKSKAAGSVGSINRGTLDELSVKKLNLEVAIKGLEARLDANKMALDQAKTEASNDRAGNTEENLLQRALQNRMEALDRIKKLRDQNAVNDDEVAAAEISVLEQQLKLEQFQQRVDSKTETVQRFEAELATNMTELNSLKQQLDQVNAQAESIVSVVGDVEHLEARRVFIQQIVEMCDAQAAELEIQNARDAALRELVNEALKSDDDD